MSANELSDVYSKKSIASRSSEIDKISIFSIFRLTYFY